jgi:hypothetical protein
MPGLLLLAGIGAVVALPPTLPTIPPGTTNILSFGAIGDGVATNTTAIQNAIYAASAAGMGTVEIPGGYFEWAVHAGQQHQSSSRCRSVLRMRPYAQSSGAVISQFHQGLQPARRGD